MPTYVYRCPEHGSLEETCPMGAAADTVLCPACAQPAPRVFTAPQVALGSAARRSLIERTERTRDVPDVVSGPAAGRTASRAPENPARARLPRP